MDGLRKVPTNVPNQEQMTRDLDLPLTKVRDPFGTHESFGAHNNARLMAFLDSYGFDYEFASSTEYYRSGRFDEMLLVALDRFDRIMEIMLPTLGPNVRRPTRPSCPSAPRPVMSCRFRPWSVIRRTAPSSTKSRTANGVEVPVTGGHVNTTAASAFLHLSDPGDTETLAAVEALLAARPDVERLLFEVLDREALDALGAAPDAALGLAMTPGVDATSSAEPPAIREGKGANHGFLPDYPEMRTGFIAWGAGAPVAREIGAIRLVDIAPLVAHLLDLDLDVPDGRLPEPWVERP